MMNSIAEADANYRAHMYDAGHLIFMMCDAMTKEILKQAEKDGKHSFKENEQNTDQTAFVESIISVLASETLAEIVRSMIDFFSDIAACSERKDRAPCEFSTCFRGAIARYVSVSSMISSAVSRQFAVMMLYNANLSSNTMNAICTSFYRSNKTNERDFFIELSILQEDVRRWTVTDKS